MPPTSEQCPECGAPQPDRIGCLDCFHALLAFENERPPAFGAVHHLTVACYYLQHPTGYAAKVLDMWTALLADSLAGRVTVKELRRRAGAAFEGARRVREPGAHAPADWPTTWPVTVRDVLKPDEQVTIEEYVERAMTWARATSETLTERARALPRR